MNRNQFLASVVAMIAGPLVAKPIRKGREIHLGEADHAYGFYLTHPIEQSREDLLAGIPLEYYPATIFMPCGEWIWSGKPSDIPKMDVPCPCGNPNHMLVKWNTYSGEEI